AFSSFFSGTFGAALIFATSRGLYEVRRNTLILHPTFAHSRVNTSGVLVDWNDKLLRRNAPYGIEDAAEDDAVGQARVKGVPIADVYPHLILDPACSHQQYDARQRQ